MDGKKLTRSFELRLESRLKNAKLVKIREKLGLTQKEVSEAIGIAKQSLCKYENLKLYPSIRNIIKLISFYNEKGVSLSIDEVFPEELKNFENPNKISFNREAPIEKILNLSYIKNQLPEGTLSRKTPLDIILKSESKEVLTKNIVDNLNENETKVLVMKYGLAGGKEMSYTEIGKIMNLSGTRISQITKKALYKLNKLITKDSKL